jgi:hypothetical protein
MALRMPAEARVLAGWRLVRCSLACGASADVDELRANGLHCLPRGPDPAADARRALATFLADNVARKRGVVIPEGELGGKIGYLVRGGCTLAPDAYLFAVIDRAVQAQAGKLPKRQ